MNLVLDIRSPIKIGYAIEKIMTHSLKGTVEGISIDDCDDRFLAEDIFAKHDMPLFLSGIMIICLKYIKRLQGKVLFNKVEIRPGSVTTVTALKGKLLFGLSGNPSAKYVGFELFVRPIIRKILFCENPFLKFEWAKLGADFPRPNPFTRFVRSKLHVENGELLTSPVGIDKSNIVMSLAKTDSLTILSGGTRSFSKSDYVNVLLQDDHEGSQTLWQ